MKIFFLIGVYLKICVLFAYANSNNYFENIICGETIAEHYDVAYDEIEKMCVFDEIHTSEDMENIFIKLRDGYQFSYQECSYTHGYSQICEWKRHDWDTYTTITFLNSNLTRLSFNYYGLMNIKTTLIVNDVGLKDLNRDDLQKFQNVQHLDLSSNKITSLGNMLLRYAQVIGSKINK